MQSTGGTNSCGLLRPGVAGGVLSRKEETRERKRESMADTNGSMPMRPRVASTGKGAGGPGDQLRRRQFKARSRELERGISAPLLSPGSEAKAPLPLSTKEAVSVGYGQGHEFVKKTFFQPTFCHHCAELLWGLKGQGMKCMGE